MELNGLANLKALIELYRDQIPDRYISEVEEQIKLTVTYLKAYEADKTVLWHEVRAAYEKEKETAELMNILKIKENKK